tara:strand:- start:79975 stop:81858 length:1884 start_codon:yes stop_codon:yes gene_type:complete
MKKVLVSAAVLLVMGCSDPEAPVQTLAGSAEQSVAAAVEETADQLSESRRLTIWLDEQFAEQLEFNPQWKTQLGDKSDYDKLNDASEEAAARQLEWRRNSVAQMQSMFDYNALDEDAKTSWDTWIYTLEREERAEPYRRHAYLFGRGGPHASLPNFMINYHKVDELSDMQAYIARLDQLDEVLGQYQQRALRAIEAGIRQPRFNYDYALAEISRITSGEPFDEDGISPLWNDVEIKINALVENDQIDQATAQGLLEDAKAVFVEQLQPAYESLSNWLFADRQNATEDAYGVWALPNGGAFYDTRLYLNTTLNLTADEIHEIGLSEVARLRAEMEAIKEQVEFDGTLAEFFVFIREDDQFYFPNTDEGRQAYLDLANKFLGGMNEKLPEYFGILPKAGLEVRRVEAFREQDGAAQHYARGTPDGSRPGIFYAHLSDMRAMPHYQLENISYHEGSPGHHMQISIQQELTDIPRFRTQYGYTAFSEGWGLYSEALGKDMGFYQDPYSDFGRLAGEIWRAIRLVVDTGMHARQWGEEQAVQYFLENSPQPESAIRSEIQRYLTNPGQATAYKIGMLKIQELRDVAMAELGDGFDYRGFHDTVLGGGALPLPVLEARVMRWIERVKVAQSAE